MIIKGPGVTGEVPFWKYILTAFDSSLRIGLALTLALYLSQMWGRLPWWLGLAGGLLIALPVYAWRAIPDDD